MEKKGRVPTKLCATAQSYGVGSYHHLAPSVWQMLVAVAILLLHCTWLVWLSPLLLYLVGGNPLVAHANDILCGCGRRWKWCQRKVACFSLCVGTCVWLVCNAFPVIRQHIWRKWVIATDTCSIVVLLYWWFRWALAPFILACGRTILAGSDCLVKLWLPPSSNTIIGCNKIALQHWNRKMTFVYVHVYLVSVWVILPC